MRGLRGAVVLGVGAAAACWALAQPPAAPPQLPPPPVGPAVEKTTRTEKTEVKTEKTERKDGDAFPDPTRPSPIYQQLLNPAKAAPGAPPLRLPAILLRGRILTRDKAPAAMLEIDGRLYLVGRDSALAVAGAPTLRVVDVTAAEVRIEVGPTSEVIVLR